MLSTKHSYGLHDDNHRHYHLILTKINKCSGDTGVVYLWFIGPQRAFKSMTPYRCRICFAYSAPQSKGKTLSFPFLKPTKELHSYKIT